MQRREAGRRHAKPRSVPWCTASCPTVAMGSPPPPPAAPVPQHKAQLPARPAPLPRHFRRRIGNVLGVDQLEGGGVGGGTQRAPLSQMRQALCGGRGEDTMVVGTANRAGVSYSSYTVRPCRRQPYTRPHTEYQHVGSPPAIRSGECSYPLARPYCRIVQHAHLARVAYGPVVHNAVAVPVGAGGRLRAFGAHLHTTEAEGKAAHAPCGVRRAYHR